MLHCIISNKIAKVTVTWLIFKKWMTSFQSNLHLNTSTFLKWYNFLNNEALRNFQTSSLLPKEGLYLSLDYSILSGTTEVYYLVVQKDNWKRLLIGI